MMPYFYLRKGTLHPILIIIKILVCPIYSDSTFPTIAVGVGSQNMIPVNKFNESVRLPLVFTQYTVQVRFQCLASYPVKWVYNYDQEHASYYIRNLQYSPVFREFTDFSNASTYKYEAVIGISARHNFKAAPELYMCTAVADPRFYRTVEASYEQFLPTNSTAPTNGTEPTSAPNKAQGKSARRRAPPVNNAFNETLVLRLVNLTTVGNDTTVLAPGGSACSATFVVKENGGTNFPEWKCLSRNGSSNNSEIEINFAYCHEGMTCENLFRTVKNQAPCTRRLGQNETCSTDSFRCISPQSFEPGVAYCSINGTVVAAQQFFYSIHPRQSSNRSSSSSSIPGYNWQDLSQNQRSRGRGTHYGDENEDKMKFTIHFKWNEVAGGEMMRMEPIRDQGYVSMNDDLTVTCRFSVYYFALGYRIALEYNNNTLKLRPYKYGYYEQRTNMLVVKDRFKVESKNLTAIYCFGPVWNSSDWANVSYPISYLKPLAPAFNLSFEEIIVYVGDPIFTLECNSNARPSPHITWSRMYHNNNGLLPRNYFHCTGMNPTSNSNCSFFNYDYNQGGFYRCNATNELGSAAKVFKITIIKKSKPVFGTSFENVTFYAGDEDQRLVCRLDERGDSVLSFLWWKEPAFGWDYDRRTADEWKFPGQIRFEDSGVYKCQATNGLGLSWKEFNVRVKRPLRPLFNDNYRTVEIMDGVPGRLNTKIDLCEGFSGDPTPNISLSRENDGWSKYPVNRITAGNYICTAANRFGTATMTVRVELRKPVRPFFKNPIERIHIKPNTESAKVELICDAEGDPMPEVFTWYKEQTRMTALDPINATTSLRISIFTRFDIGKYSCHANSVVGTAVKTFVVDMEAGITALPRIVAATTETGHESTTTNPTGLGQPGKLENTPSSGEPSSSGLVVTIVLLILLTLVVVGVGIWKYRKHRREMGTLMRKSLPDLDEAPEPDWRQMNSSSRSRF